MQSPEAHALTAAGGRLATGKAGLRTKAPVLGGGDEVLMSGAGLGVPSGRPPLEEAPPPPVRTPASIGHSSAAPNPKEDAPAAADAGQAPCGLGPTTPLTAPPLLLVTCTAAAVALYACSSAVAALASACQWSAASKLLMLLTTHVPERTCLHSPEGLTL